MDKDKYNKSLLRLLDKSSDHIHKLQFKFDTISRAKDKILSLILTNNNLKFNHCISLEFEYCYASYPIWDLNKFKNLKYLHLYKLSVSSQLIK